MAALWERTEKGWPLLATNLLHDICCKRDFEREGGEVRVSASTPGPRVFFVASSSCYRMDASLQNALISWVCYTLLWWRIQNIAENFWLSHLQVNTFCQKSSVSALVDEVITSGSVLGDITERM